MIKKTVLIMKIAHVKFRTEKYWNIVEITLKITGNLAAIRVKLKYTIAVVFLLALCSL